MDYEIKRAMTIVGFQKRTSFQNAAKDIPAFWEYVQQNNLLGFIPNRADKNCFYALYTDYATDEYGEYTMILGAEVTKINEKGLPDMLVSRTISEASYAVFIAKGEQIANAVTETWQKIWKTPLDRAYTIDFDKYDLALLSKKVPEVEVCVALKSEIK